MKIWTIKIFTLGIPLFLACIADREQNISIRWENQTSSSPASFRGVSAVSPSVCWVSGSSGTVLRTTNGGAEWLKLEVPDSKSQDFRDVEAFDTNTALVISAGMPAKIYKTTDGGQAWQEKYSNSTPGIFFDAVSFWDRRNGIAFSDPIEGQLYLIRTTDSGESWQRIPPESFPAPMDGEAGFAASGTCLTVYGDSLAWFGTGGSTARVFRSTNRGDSWVVSETPILSGNPPEGIFSICAFDKFNHRIFSIVFQDASNGVIVGGNYQDLTGTERNAAWTTDGGLTWHLVSEKPPAGFRECAVYLTPNRNKYLLAVGPSGSDVSSDGGRIWTEIDSIGYHAISFLPGEELGWAVGGEGRIAKVIIIKK